MTINSSDTETVIAVRGATSQTGAQYVQLRVDGVQSPWIAKADFRGSAKPASDKLVTGNIALLDNDMKTVKRLVASHRKFEARAFAEHVGWHGAFFAMPGGSVVGVEGTKKPVILYARDRARDKAAGTLAGWLEGVAEPLARHKIASFLLMAPFAAPLLRFSPLPHNFGFEVAGPGGTGKSTIAKCVASTAGPIDGEGSNVQSMNLTTNALDQRMREYHDLPMVLEEWNLFLLGSGWNAGGKSAELVFRLSDGAARMRFNDPRTQSARFLWVVSSNIPLPEVLCGLPTDQANAALDRMMTIPIGDDRRLGVFDDLKDGPQTVADHAAIVISAARANHGHALRHFIAAVAEEVAKDERSFRAKIAALVKQFERHAARWKKLPSERVAQAFGLVYAAGVLAKKFGALPDTFRPSASATAACRLHVASREAALAPLDRLKALHRSGRFYDVRGKRVELHNGLIAKYAGFIDTGYNGDELLLTQEQLLRLSNEPGKFLRHPDIKRILVHEKGRRKIWRTCLHRLGHGRCYCFRMFEIDGTATE